MKEALFNACGRKGLFTPKDRLRGRGSWTLRGGELVYHCGEDLWLYDRQTYKFRELPIGMLEDMLYPRLSEIPAPWFGPLGINELERTVGSLLHTFRKWNWERPDVDPVLLLGWVGVAYLGGALDWRPACLLCGDKGTGKSTLQDALKLLFGFALFHSADTTAAGIYQRMAHDARPVALDEVEPGADPRKHAQVVQLMRDASSGAMGRRGGADGAPSGISDAQRLPIFGDQQPDPILARLVTGRDPAFAAARSRSQAAAGSDRCRHVRARGVGALDAAMAKICGLLEFYRGVLDAGGHDARGQMTYGTLLACADMMLGPELGERSACRCRRMAPIGASARRRQAAGGARRAAELAGLRASAAHRACAGLGATTKSHHDDRRCNREAY